MVTVVLAIAAILTSLGGLASLLLAPRTARKLQAEQSQVEVDSVKSLTDATLVLIREIHALHQMQTDETEKLNTIIAELRVQLDRAREQYRKCCRDRDRERDRNRGNNPGSR